MRKYFYILILCLPLIFNWNQVSATHIMGIDISYSCTSTSCIYDVEIRLYLDCEGGLTQSYLPLSTTGPNPIPSDLEFYFQGTTPGCTAPTPVGAWQVVSTQDVTPVCPALQSQTGCNPAIGNPVINGSAEFIMRRTYDFCATNCDRYQMVYDDCCRNGDITTIFAPLSTDIILNTGFIDLSVTPCNNSPSFIDPISGENIPPVAYICEGQPYFLSVRAFDQDGDSLAYKITDCLGGSSGGAVDYDFPNGYTANSPLGPTWQVTLDPITGILSLVPSPTGAEEVGVICLVVEEWRNGQLIGTIGRDLQVTVLDAAFCPFPNPITDSIQNATANGLSVPASSPDQVAICAGAEICFDIPVIPADPSLNYTMYWDQTLAGATFVDAANPTIVDTVEGNSPVARFCWTPDPTFRGFYYFLLTVEDDACPLRGRTQFTFTINVFNGESSYVVDIQQLGCNEVQLSVAPDPGLPFTPAITTVDWYGNGNLEFNPNTDTTTFNHFYPEPGQYFYSVDVDNVLGCANTITGIVDIPTGTVADAGENVTICSNEPLTLGSPALTGVTYSWSPATNLSDATIAQPDFNFPNQTGSAVTFDYVLTASDGTCTTFDYISVTVNPSLEAQLLPANPQICLGDSITITAIPNIGTSNTSQYLWNTGSADSSIRVAPTANTTYSVVVFSDSAGGCSSLPQNITVEVLEPEVASISGDLQVCPGESTTLTASGGTTYLWTGGSTSSTLTINNVNSDTTVVVTPINALGCAGVPDSVTVTPSESPVAAFSTGNVCEGAMTSFTDNSILNTGQIIAWDWDFGDNTTSTQQNPDHRYVASGTFTVILTVTSQDGCQNSFTRSVVVSPQPEVDFDIVNVCEGQVNEFSSTSTISVGSLINYTWDFGDGTTGIGANAQHQYGEYGFYNTTLTVTSEQGCVASFVKAAIAYALPEPAFTQDNTCQGTVVQFTDNTVVPGGFDRVVSWEWNFSDPSDPTAGDSIQSTSYTYQDAGTYFPSLAVVTDKGCASSTQQEITIFEEPVASFTFDQTCENLPVRYTSSVQLAANTRVLNYSWDLGNGQFFEGGQTEAVSGNYVISGGSGIYDVQLIIQSTGNCADTVTRPVFINPAPQVNYQADPVCLFDSTEFRDLTQVDSGGTLSQWLYEFGDSRVSTNSNPNYFYFEDGFYETSLTVVTDSGCINSRSRQVQVYERPSFSLFQQDTVCFGDQGRLIAVSQPGTTISWYFEKTDEIPFQTGNSYITPPLPFTQTYYVEAETNRGCISERFPLRGVVFDAALLDLTASDSIVELPQSIIEFGIATNIEIDEYEWDFGDGNTSNLSAPVHEYSFPGKFLVRVKITDINGCSEELSRIVEVKRRSVITMPTAFSPNNDRSNDFFRVGTYNVSDFNIKIFNRLGLMVYESDNADFAWDGMTLDNRPALQGVYVYIITAKDLEGNDIEETRTLTLLR
ncbi:MAG: PKD domain-containing protein [Bacteroidota bacterium]